MTRVAWMTTAAESEDPAICRVYSIPAHLLQNFDGAVKNLCAAELWTRGDDLASDTVQYTVAAYAAIIDAAYGKGCHMVGEIIELATDTVPSWALVCDGATYANADYPELAAVISAGLVVDGSHFRTPDRVNRFGMYGPPTGVQGGENTHVLTETEMPAHTHTDAGHHHTEEGIGVALSSVCGDIECFSAAPETNDTSTAAADIQATGGGAGHNNLPQYEGTMFVIVAMSS
jgi:microcystin-dependent protein